MTSDISPENQKGAPHQPIAPTGRNEPCPCGSRKKYKRCCGVSAAPKLGTPAQAPAAADLVPGFDPSQMDPQWMMQFSQMLQRLPKGQMQRLQSLVQRAMAGKDVTSEAKQFEQSLPPQILEFMKSSPLAAMTGIGADSSADKTATTVESTGMSEEEARRIVEQAAASGKISSDQAGELLQERADPAGSSKFSKLWKGLTGKSGS